MRFSIFAGRASEGCRTLAEAMGATRLRSEGSRFTGGENRTLINWGWVYRAGRRGSIQPYQAQLETKRLALRATTYMNQDSGEMVAGDPQTRVTPKGVVDIAERLTSKAVA